MQPANREQYRILIVDDEVRMCQSLKLLREHQGYLVETTGTGRGALRRLAEHSFDLVLLDIILEDMGGQEVLGYIRENRIYTRAEAHSVGVGCAARIPQNWLRWRCALSGT
mgnify:CR=1 FL=1